MKRRNMKEKRIERCRKKDKNEGKTKNGKKSEKEKE